MYKEFTKSAGDTYDDIARQAYGTTERAGDIAKLNNNIESGKVLAFVEKNAKNANSNNGETKKEVSIVVGDNNYNDFAEYSLIDGLGSVKGAVFIFNKTDTEYNFKIGDDVTVYDESGLFLKGFVVNASPEVDNRANWTQLEVKSYAGLMLDGDMPYPHEFSNLSIRNILSSVADYYSQKITFSDEKELDEVFVNEIGTSYTSDVKEKAYNFMNRVCRSRGLLLTDTGNGLFVGRFKASTQEKLNLIDGECLGVINIKLVVTGDGLGRYYEINSQYPERASTTIQIPFPLPVIKRYNSNDYNAKDLSSIGARIACTDIGEHIKLLAILSENKPLKSGSFAIVKNSKTKINEETDFVIERVERKHPDSTVLIMTLPCAYTFEIPKSLPLC